MSSKCVVIMTIVGSSHCVLRVGVSSVFEFLSQCVCGIVTMSFVFEVLYRTGGRCGKPPFETFVSRGLIASGMFH